MKYNYFIVQCQRDLVDSILNSNNIYSFRKGKHYTARKSAVEFSYFAIDESGVEKVVSSSAFKIKTEEEFFKETIF